MPSKIKQKAHADLCAEDLYTYKDRKVDGDIQSLIDQHVQHVPERFGWAAPRVILKESAQVEIRLIKHHDFDERRFWRLATVWYKKKPVMVIQNAGREGDDFVRRYITDAVQFTNEINTTAVPVTDPSVRFKGLTFFEGWDFRDELPKSDDF